MLLILPHILAKMPDLPATRMVLGTSVFVIRARYPVWDGIAHFYITSPKRKGMQFSTCIGLLTDQIFGPRQSVLPFFVSLSGYLSG